MRAETLLIYCLGFMFSNSRFWKTYSLNKWMEGWMERQAVLSSLQMYDKTNVFHRSFYPWERVISKMTRLRTWWQLWKRQIVKEKREFSRSREHYLIIVAKLRYIRMWLLKIRSSHQRIGWGGSSEQFLDLWCLVETLWVLPP